MVEVQGEVLVLGLVQRGAVAVAVHPVADRVDGHVGLGLALGLPGARGWAAGEVGLRGRSDAIASRRRSSRCLGEICTSRRWIGST